MGLDLPTPTTLFSTLPFPAISLPVTILSSVETTSVIENPAPSCLIRCFCPTCSESSTIEAVATTIITVRRSENLHDRAFEEQNRYSTRITNLNFAKSTCRQTQGANCNCETRGVGDGLSTILEPTPSNCAKITISFEWCVAEATAA